ncbi:MAG: peptidoglycan-associated lipoprotein Pal [Elusimicrobiaceae bacterium]
MKRKIVLSALITLAVSMTACAPKKNIKTPEDEAKARAEQIGEQNIPGSNDDLVVSDKSTEIPVLPGMEEDQIIEAAEPEANIRGGEFAAKEDFAPVLFAFDKFALTDSARETATKNAETLKSYKNSDVLVEGHCDDRGTIEYNIALGQKRAKTVRDYYATLGVPAEKLTTISYGKEKPVCPEQNEACWAQNRRAETKTRNGK